MSDTSETSPKTPARTAAEIIADMKRERAGLSSSFEALRGDLDEALAAGKLKAMDVGKKAVVIGSALAAVVATAAAARVLIRRRSR